jgi:L-ascorbate metabolism protein UlaG (beta-lactamase superfamily)
MKTRHRWSGATAVNPCIRVFFFFSLAFSLLSCTLPPPPFDEAAWRARVKSTDPALLYASHFKEGRFFNPWMPAEEKGLIQLLRWRITSGSEYTDEEREFRPAFIENARERMLALPPGDFIMWVGHATFLIRLNGAYWLTDPIFSARALLPKRTTPPAITADDLRGFTSRLNVIISHNHYDHLDKDSILDLPADTRVFVPLGLKPFLQSLGKKDVIEMDWWQSLEVGADTTLVCLPMQHWSRRIGQGFNETLWASFMLTTPAFKVYFGGDTGYFIGHQEIGRRFPGIDYALLPATAYHPRWFMHYAHMNIEETLEAFKDLGARFMIPQQWGTFQLGDEPAGYPIVDLKRKLAGRNPEASRFVILNLGEIHQLVGKSAGNSSATIPTRSGEN